jgi:hypothetical protein
MKWQVCPIPPLPHTPFFFLLFAFAANHNTPTISITAIPIINGMIAIFFYYTSTTIMLQ